VKRAISGCTVHLGTLVAAVGVRSCASNGPQATTAVTATADSIAARRIPWWCVMKEALSCCFNPRTFFFYGSCCSAVIVPPVPCPHGSPRGRSHGQCSHGRVAPACCPCRQRRDRMLLSPTNGA